MNMRNWKVKGLIIFVILLLIPAIAFAGPGGRVVGDDVSLRATPSADGAVIGSLYKNDIVEVLIERSVYVSNGYVRVRVSRATDKDLQGQEGWVAKRYVYVANPE
jgi:hypothetical protein